MCHNWKRRTGSTKCPLADIDKGIRVGPLEEHRDRQSLSGEPTTRNDLVELCEVMLNRCRGSEVRINTTA